MSEEEKFDVIVVGAGPAGITCAYVLATAGLHVVVFERGPYPGSKNAFGGVLYSTVLNKLIPDFWTEAPVERHVTQRNLLFMSPENGVKVTIQSERYDRPPYNNSFICRRAVFDQWYATKAEEAGAIIVPDTVVDDLLWKDGRVVGVRARREEGDLYADVVVAADGVNSFLAKKAGLRGEFALDQLGLGVMETIYLGKEVIDDRFNVRDDRGAVYECVGDVLRGVWGLGYIYTGRDVVSVGVGTTLKVICDHKIVLQEMLEHFKNHPLIRDYLRGGEIKEYLAHMTPEGGYDYIPEKLCTHGLVLVGDAAGLLNASPHYEGTNLAMASGMLAAEAILHARARNDFSAEALAYYRQVLENSFVMKDMRKYRKLFRYLQHNEEFFGPYLNLLTELAADFYTVDGRTKAEHEREMRRKVWQRLPKAKVAWQLLKGMYAYL